MKLRSNHAYLSLSVMSLVLFSCKSSNVSTPDSAVQTTSIEQPETVANSQQSVDDEILNQFFLQGSFQEQYLEAAIEKGLPSIGAKDSKTIPKMFETHIPFLISQIDKYWEESIKFNQDAIANKANDDLMMSYSGKSKESLDKFRACIAVLNAINPVPPSEEQPLLSLLNSTELKRRFALLTLIKIERPDADQAQFLGSLVRDGDEQVRNGAFQALSQMGSRASNVVPLLKTMNTVQDSETQRIADLIKKIEGQ